MSGGREGAWLLKACEGHHQLRERRAAGGADRKPLKCESLLQPELVMAVLTQQKGENTRGKPLWREGSESGQLEPGGSGKVGHREHGARAMGRRNPAAEDQLVCAGNYPDRISSGLGIEEKHILRAQPLAQGHMVSGQHVLVALVSWH